jgi:hydroxymethylglutaryl-coenzyme A reductase
MFAPDDFKTPMKRRTSERRWPWPHENWGTTYGFLYKNFSPYFPSMVAATVGGGTSFGTARECLETLECYGNGKSKRFAEIIAAT